METPRLTRRSALAMGAGALVLGAAAEALDAFAPRAAAAPAGPRFHSRPELDPPLTTITVPAQDTAPGLVMLTAAKASTKQFPGLATDQHGPLIVDNRGEVVWFLSQSESATNLQVQTYQGDPVLTWWQGEIVPPGYGRGRYVIAGADYQPITTVGAGNGLHGDLHEFILTPRGTALFTAFHAGPRDLSAQGGPGHGTLLNSLFQEVEVAGGAVRFEWSGIEHIGLDETYAPVPRWPRKPWDFLHTNSIDVLDDGNYLISARHTCALYKIDARSGEVIWRLGGKRSDFAMGPRTRFWFQHHARHHPGGRITLFDDGAGIGHPERVSRGLMLGVDEQAMRVTLEQEYLPRPAALAYSKGSVQLLEDGSVFIGWGSVPCFSEQGPDGTMRFDGLLGAHSNSYRAFRCPWVGRPRDMPAISAQRPQAAGPTLVYASWNGATEVHDWVVLAGGERGHLSAVDRFPRTGFETVMAVDSVACRFAVEARDRDGRTLGRSGVITVI